MNDGGECGRPQSSGFGESGAKAGDGSGQFSAGLSVPGSWALWRAAGGQHRLKSRPPAPGLSLPGGEVGVADLVYLQGFFRCGPQTCSSSNITETLLEMQTSRLHPGSDESGALGQGPHIGIDQALQEF